MALEAENYDPALKYGATVKANDIADGAVDSDQLATDSVITAKIADANVTGAKLSTAANTRVVAVNIGGIANGGQQNHVFVAPTACTITDFVLVSNTATSSSDVSNNYTFKVTNQTDTVDLHSAVVSTNGNEIAADTAFHVTPDQNATLAADDVLELVIVENGTGTDLSSAKVTVFVYYTVSA